MKYKEFTDKLSALVGPLSWAVVGQLNKKYSQDFILSCAGLIPPGKRLIEPKAKALYLKKLCSIYSTADVSKTEKKIVDIPNFNID